MQGVAHSDLNITAANNTIVDNSSVANLVLLQYATLLSYVVGTKILFSLFDTIYSKCYS